MNIFYFSYLIAIYFIAIYRKSFGKLLYMQRIIDLYHNFNNFMFIYTSHNYPVVWMSRWAALHLCKYKYAKLDPLLNCITTNIMLLSLFLFLYYFNTRISILWLLKRQLYKYICSNITTVLVTRKLIHKLIAIKKLIIYIHIFHLLFQYQGSRNYI